MDTRRFYAYTVVFENLLKIRLKIKIQQFKQFLHTFNNLL